MKHIRNIVKNSGSSVCCYKDIYNNNLIGCYFFYLLYQLIANEYQIHRRFENMIDSEAYASFIW